VSIATATIVSLLPTSHGSTRFRSLNTKMRSPFVFSIENERMSASPPFPKASFVGYE